MPRRLRVVIAADSHADHLNCPVGSTPAMRGIELSVCPQERFQAIEFSEPVGWHLTNFMSAKQLLSKLSAYSHASEPYAWQAALRGEQHMQDVIRRCSVPVASSEFEQIESIELTLLHSLPQVMNTSSPAFSASHTALLLGDADISTSSQRKPTVICISDACRERESRGRGSGQQIN